MNRSETVAIITKGAMLWGKWVYFQQYAGANSTYEAKRLAQIAGEEWRLWRDKNETANVNRAQCLARIANEIVTMTEEG